MMEARSDRRKKDEASDLVIALAVNQFPHLTAEQAGKYIKMLRERNRGGKIHLDDLEELWKNDLGAVGGGARPEGFARGEQTGPVEEEEEECSICLDPLMSGDNEYQEMKPCKHRFHLHCIQVNSGLRQYRPQFSLMVHICRTGSTLGEELAIPVPTVGTTSLM